MKLNIRARLLFYNILIILISSFLIIFIFNYMNNKSSEVLYNAESVTIDENVNKVKNILYINYSYEAMSIILKQYNYKLYVYKDGKLIYGENNNSLNQLLKDYPIRKNGIKTLFIDNSTTVMKIDNDVIYFAMHAKFSRENLFLFLNSYNPFQRMLMKVILISFSSLIIILFFAILFSNRILSRVMHPVKLLKEGAVRVEHGDYQTPIVYENDDEFSSVINNFNQMQESLREKTEKARNYELAKKEMINGISHDIRTPLTVVKGNIKGIQDGVASTKVKRDKYLDIAYNRVLDIEHLLNRLFDTFNYETGEIKLNKEKVDIEKFINEIIYTNENIINKMVSIDIKVLSKNNYLYIDKIQFKRIFDNLINNTVKHNREKDNLKINIRLWQDGKFIKISFKDNGKGVREENLSQIFNEFFKEDESRNNDKNSSGLGLFIVKKIIESHDGKIIAKNKKGLYFEMTLIGDDQIG